MKRKLNCDDILHLIYESYKGIINEGGKILPKQLEELHPEFNLYVSNGEFIFNLAFNDERAIKALENFQSYMLVRQSNRAASLGQQLTPDQENSIRNIFKIDKSIDKKTKQIQAVFPKLRIFNPFEILTEDGQHVNSKSADYNNFASFFGAIDECLKPYGCKVGKRDKQIALKSIVGTVNNQISKDDDAQIETNIKNLFFKICQEISEPETLKLIKTIHIQGEDLIHDHKFNLHNKLRIIQQGIEYGTTPTYIATELQWLKFNRRVVDFSQPYHYVTANLGKVSTEEIKRVLASQGKAMSTTKDGKIGNAARRGGETEVNFINGRKSFSFNSPGYDVSATEQISGTIDKFNDEPAMINNLTGELNNAALNAMGIVNDSNKDDKDERTNKLNNIFDTSNYNIVNLNYCAICRAAGTKPIIDKTDVKGEIAESTKLISWMVTDKLRSFEKGGGHIALSKNFEHLVNIGTIMIQAEIGLPMDNAPSMAWAQDYRPIFNTLSTIVFEISNKIAKAKKDIRSERQGNVSINEIIDTYSSLIIHEEWFNKTLNLIKENAENII